MVTIKSILLSSEKPKDLAVFYKKVLKVDPKWEEGDWIGFTSGDVGLAIGPHDKVKGKNSAPERMMFNLETDDVVGEFARIKGYGTKVISKPYEMGSGGMLIATFADPDGNYFQLMSPMS
jgi:predicted enzyme related to lactoylglutathione lyase